MKKNRTVTIIFSVIAIIYIAINLFYLDKYPLVWADDVLNNAESAWSLIRKGNFGSDMAVLAEGRLDKTNIVWGRIFIGINALFIYIFGLGPFQARILPFISGLLTLFFLFLVTRRLYDNKTAVIAAVFLAFSHIFAVHSHLGRPDMMVAMFLMITLYVFLKAVEKNSALLYFLSGLAASLTFDIHPPGGMMAIPVLFALIVYYLILKKTGVTGIFFACAGVFAGAMWWVALHILPDAGTFFIQYYEYLHRHRMDPPIVGFQFLNVLKQEFQRYYSFFWLGRFHRNMFYLAVFAAAVLHNLLIFKKIVNARPVLVALAAALFGLTFFVPNKTNFYLIYIWPFLSIITADMILRLFNSRTALLKYAGLIISAGIIALYSFENVYKIVQYRKSDYNSYIEKLKKHIPPGFPVLGPIHYWFGFTRSRPYFTDYFGYWVFIENGKPTGYDLVGFIRKKKIRYIIEDEIFFPWDRSQIERFFKKNCRLVGVVEDKFYGEGDIHKVRGGNYTTRIWEIVR
ncbi:MAG: glycosyltransferase family 39 protein [Elusimicrobiota bacterium]